jgi:hypothetical protein
MASALLAANIARSISAQRSPRYFLLAPANLTVGLEEPVRILTASCHVSCTLMVFPTPLRMSPIGPITQSHAIPEQKNQHAYGAVPVVLFSSKNTPNYSAFRKSLCTYKRCWKRCPRSIVSKSWIKQLHTLPVLHYNRCLTTEYSETTAHFNGNFDTDNQIYIP